MKDLIRDDYSHVCCAGAKKKGDNGSCTIFQGTVNGSNKGIKKNSSIKMAHLYIRTKVGGDNKGPKQTICCPVFFFTVVALLLYNLTLGNFRNNTGSRGATVQANLCKKAS